MRTGDGRSPTGTAFALGRCGIKWSLIIGLALASAGWTWTVEQSEATLTVKRPKLARTVYPDAGTPFFVCDANRASVADRSSCVAGTFGGSDGVAPVNIAALDEDVTSWCLVVGEDWDSCVSIPELAHLTVARHAASLRSRGEYLAAASKYREAAERGRGLLRDIGSQHLKGGPLEGWYLDLSSQCEEEFLQNARSQAQALYEEGKTHDAIAILEPAVWIASENNRTREENDFRKALAKLREDDAKQQREILEVRASCESVGDTGRQEEGPPLAVWLCKRREVEDEETGDTTEAIDVVVEDGSKVWVRAQLVGTMYVDETVEAHARLSDVTGTKVPELLVHATGECGHQSLEVLSIERRGLRRLWTLEVPVSNYESDCGSGDWAGMYDPVWWPASLGDPSRPKVGLGENGFVWMDEPMVWEEEASGFVPSEASRNRYREQEIARAREYLAAGHPGVAHAILPDGAPEELVREIKTACERVFLKALGNSNLTNEGGQKASPAEARGLKAAMLKIGLNCAPDSQALKRRLETLEAQIKVDRERSAREAEKRVRAERIERFQKWSMGKVKFGMTRAEARKACLEQNGSWDSGSSLGACNYRSGRTFAAGFCGSRACSLYMTNPSPWSGKLGYHNIVSKYERHFGEGERSKAGAAEVVRWRLDAQRSIKVTLLHIRGRDLLSVALHSKGER
jgi:hypothetical protein